MDFDYFTVSQYVVFSLAAIIIPIFIFRLLRIFPVYVKTGSIGDDIMSSISLSDLFGKKATPETRRKLLHNFLTETHPSVVLMDMLAMCLIGFALFILWGIIPFIIGIWLILWSIIKFAKHSRKKYVKKEEFVARLDGTHEGGS